MESKKTMRERLKELAGDERFIPGIYNYCDRWCERCPQTLHCLNFSMMEEKSSDPGSNDIRNEKFWKELSEVFEETMELLKEIAKEEGIDLEAASSAVDMESLRAGQKAAENHVICRAARSYGKMVGEWCEENEGILLGAAVGDRGREMEEAFEVIRWYQHFVAAKVIRAVRGKREDEKEGADEFPSDSDGSAKIALIAIDRSIGAWTVVLHSNRLYAESIMGIISFLDRLGQAVEQTFPDARSFIRPGFDGIDLNVSGPKG